MPEQKENVPKQQLTALKDKRARVKSQLTRFKNFIGEINDDSSIFDISTRLSKVEELWDKYDNIQCEIEELDDTCSYEEERVNFEASYFDAVAQAKQILAERRSAEVKCSYQTNDVQTVSSIKLPTINIPEFHGQYDQWFHFHDTFNALIHSNQSLTEIQRFHYLLASLKGDAAEVIQSLEVSGSNYEVAWSLLRDRYENKKLIINKHVKALFELTPVEKESHSGIRQLLDTTQKHLRALASLEQPTQYWDTLIIYLVSSKLNQSTRKEWETSIQNNDVPTMQDLIKFLTNKAQVLEAIYGCQMNDKKVSNIQTSNTNKWRQTQRGFPVNTYSSTYKPSCPFCRNSHSIYNCEEFLRLPVSDRMKAVIRMKRCLNCLRSEHFNGECRSGGCRTCNQKHNSMLHEEANVGTNNHSQSQKETKINDAIISTHCLNPEKTQILLLTAIIYIYDKQGNTHECRALLDSGSQCNFITYDLSKKLGLSVSNINIPVKGIQQLTTKLKHITEVKIKSRLNYFQSTISCLIIPRITDELPTSSFDVKHLKTPDHVMLADPNYNKSGSIDLLLGASLFWDLICIGQLKLNNQPILQKTKLGWIMSGPVTIQSANNDRNSFCCFTTRLEDTLTRFWEIEEVQPHKILSNEEKLCQDIFEKTIYINNEGRYVVTLPLHDNYSKLGESKSEAIKRLKSMERKFEKQTELKRQYQEFLKEYEDLGHMTEISEGKEDEETVIYYMPHHAVVKPSSTTTKLRVVFDASAKSSTGLSLNETMLAGPIIQEELFSIVVRFRTHRFVLTADIRKMYRQVVVKKEHRILQRIVWRSESNKPIKTYELNTVTYGTAAGPYLAIRSLHEVANEHIKIHPITSKIIIRDFYVDDLLTGCNSIEEAQTIKQDITTLLKTRGFEITKWNSNEPNILEDMSQEHLHPLHINISDGAENKILGLVWNANQDTFQYSQTFNINQERVTKRSILSIIAQIFDPLGLIGPTITKTKIILQKLWQLKMGWDEALPMELHTMWLQFKNQLESIKNIYIPRHVICINPIHVQLHGFSDASEVAYGACVYLRSTNQLNEHKCQLLCAKSRVAPLKSISLPRLELCGALLLAKLVRKCDSTITLYWIQKEPQNWKTFVSNRVAEIQELTKNGEWLHGNSEDNPADLISRGVTPDKLQSSNLWWFGPQWIEREETNWEKSYEIIISEIPDQKQNQILTFTTQVDMNFNIFNKYSQLTKLQRIIGYCLRFKNNSRNIASKRMVGPLRVEELTATLNSLLKLAQSQSFSIEIASLRVKKPLKRDSKILSLNPFLDEQGLLRVGGRLVYANIDYDQRHPILLGKSHKLTELIIMHEHTKLLHAGCQSVLNSLRRKYWPISAKNITRKIIYQCVKCFKAAPIQTDCIMGNLPSVRVTPTRPFYSTGVDYAGPFFIKEGSYRTRKLIKTYLCVFVCLSTKAVHVELAQNLTTEAFLNCLRRFVSRRGLCSDIFSDNGTNFIGAKNELNALYDILQNKNQQEKITNTLSKDNIQWHLIPPRSPHFGGLREAAVKSIKYHLTRIVGKANLTYEELYTIVVQVESCLNSRPISALSNDPNDLLPLTPGHFLIGDSLKALPQRNFPDVNINRLKRFERIQLMFKQIWERWHHDYLHQLQQRHKWKQQQPSRLQPGTLVILKEDNMSPLYWPLGRITQLHPGADGVTRVVSVKVSRGNVKRPVSKVCLVPIDNIDE